MTIEDVAHNLEMSWNTVKNIEKVYLEKHFSKPDLSKVRHIAIDEFAVSKGHVYMTVVMDLDTTRVLYVGEGRSQESLHKFWKRIRKKKVTIEAVAMDMWPAYIASVMEHCPGADIVFDHFHIVKMLNQKLDEIRRDLYRDETEYNKRDLIKGTRWLLLRNKDNLTDKAKERLEEALTINKPLASVYYLKEELKLLWRQVSLEKALEFLELWVAKAYGYRDFEFFKLKIYAIHLARYELL